MKNRISQLFNIRYPIVQAGMVWCSGWRLAAAVSNGGGLGLIGSGSMTPEILREHIIKCRNTTTGSFGVNLPLLIPTVEEHIKVILEEQVPIVFTSAGNPKTWTRRLKDHGLVVAHVVSSVKFAQKSEEAGVDAIVGEGFEAGGHNGIEETTTLCLIPEIVDSVSLPVLAAGGIVSGRSMLAAMALGADGVQVGSRFAASQESSCHQNFKEKIVGIKEGDTKLAMKKLIPVRLIKNEFYSKVQSAEDSGTDVTKLRQILGKGRARKGMFLGDMVEGELEIGQAASMIYDIKPAGDIVSDMMYEFTRARATLCKSEIIGL